MKGMNVPKYCRKLMKKEDYPKTLEIYRENMLCLTVDVTEASKLLLVENSKVGPKYVKYRENPFLKVPAACDVPAKDAFK